MGSRDSLESRTSAKLDYARIHLEELRKGDMSSSGSAFARAHEESCLFHIIGAKDAFLQEINAAYGLGLEIWKVRESTLEDALKKAGKTSPALSEIQALQTDDDSWMAVARELRNHGTHQSNIPRIFHAGTGPGPQPTYFRNPRTGKEIKQHVPDFFHSTIAQMEDLIVRLRSGLPT